MSNENKDKIAEYKQQIQQLKNTNSELINEVGKLYKELNDNFAPKIGRAYSNISKSLVSLNPFFEFVRENAENFKKIYDALSKSKIISKISYKVLKFLKDYYWVIPFEYEYERLSNLSKYEDKKTFEQYMLKYFNNNRVKRLFSKIRAQCISKDKKELLKQIENAYFNEKYAICITCLISLLDGLTLCLLAKESEHQHSSHKAIGEMLEYINEDTTQKFNYEIYLKVLILNNFYEKLYKNLPLKELSKHELSRNLNSHGVQYLNTREDTIRLLNAIWFCQEIINETELQEQFTKKKNDKKFHIKGRKE